MNKVTVPLAPTYFNLSWVSFKMISSVSSGALPAVSIGEDGDGEDGEVDVDYVDGGATVRESS